MLAVENSNIVTVTNQNCSCKPVLGNTDCRELNGSVLLSRVIYFDKSLSVNSVQNTDSYYAVNYAQSKHAQLRAAKCHLIMENSRFMVCAPNL